MSNEAAPSPAAPEALPDDRQRRLDAKRKRIGFLDALLRDLDALVFGELLALYYLDCSFFWFLVRSLVHVATLTPLPDLHIAHQNDDHKAYMALVLFPFVANLLLHLLCAAPQAPEESRGYLHGGLMIDFVGQQGPTAKWRLAALDVCILLLQLVMVSVTVKKRELKKTMASISASPSAQDILAGRGQDQDAEERGELRRSDTLSDAGTRSETDRDNEEGLLNAYASESVSDDALELLSSGQSVIGDFTLIDTLWQEHKDYTLYRQTRSEGAGTAGLSPAALRQLHHIRTTFGVGVG